MSSCAQCWHGSEAKSVNVALLNSQRCFWTTPMSQLRVCRLQTYTHMTTHVHRYVRSFTHAHKDVLVSYDRVLLHIQWSGCYKNSLATNRSNNRKPAIVGLIEASWPWLIVLARTVCTCMTCKRENLEKFIDLFLVCVCLFVLPFQRSTLCWWRTFLFCWLKEIRNIAWPRYKSTG